MIDSPATSPISPIGHSGLSIALGKSIGAHRKLFLAEGVVLVVLGILEVFAPFVAGVVATLFIGSLFLLAGVSGLIFSSVATHSWVSLLRGLVQANQRNIGSHGRVYTASTSSMAATNSLLAFGGMTHCCFRCGLRMFFSDSARSCCRWRDRQ
jgi:hypothetical protein